MNVPVLTHIFNLRTVSSLSSRTILSVQTANNVDDITVAYETAYSSISFPAQITVTLSDGSVIPVSVLWSQGSYNNAVAGTYFLSGTLINLPNNVINPDGVTAVIAVTVLDYDDSSLPNAKALFQAAGTGVGAATATQISVAWPTHLTDDVGFLCIETDTTDPLISTPTGWSVVSGSPQSAANGSARSRLTVFERRATSNAEANVTLNSTTGDHIFAVIVTFRGCYKKFSAVDTSSGSIKTANDTTVSITGVTANQNGNDVLYIASRSSDVNTAQYSGQANASLVSVTERYDLGTNLGNGGGLGIWTGNLTLAGTTGTLTATSANLTVAGYLCISLKGVNNFSSPTQQATNFALVGDRQFTFTKGGGSKTLVLKNSSGIINASFLPISGVTYTVGQVLGGGNTVIYDGSDNKFATTWLGFAQTPAIRGFSYNNSGSGPLYNTNTDTNNPITPTTPSDIAWYLYHLTISPSTRNIAHPENISFSCSKFYSGAATELSDRFQLYVVGDNNAGPTATYHYDQTFLFEKLKADGLPFTEGWIPYVDGAGEPIAVLTKDFAEPNGLSVQNWLGNPTVFADNNLVAYYSYNVSNVSTRYSVGRAVSTDKGRTWTRTATNITSVAGGEDHYQFQQAFWSASLSKWIILSPNARTGTEGRWASMRVYLGTDGATGLNFTKISDDIYFGTEIDLGGFALQGPMWLSGSRLNWYATEELISPALKSTPRTNPATLAYQWLQKTIIQCSADLTDLTTSSTPTIRIESRLYSTDQQAIASVYPGSLKYTHGGLDHILISCFLYKPEDGNQISLDVRVLSNGVISDGKSRAIGRNVYPNYMHRFYKMHQAHLDDTYQSSTILPIELMNGDAGTIAGSGGTDVTQFNMNGVIMGTSKYLSFPSFTHDTQYLGLKMVVSAPFVTGSSNINGIVEKLGTFKITFVNEVKMKLELTGSDGIKKKIFMISASSNSALKHNLWGAAFSTRLGFIVRLNAGATDLDVFMNMDYTMGVSVTTIQNDVFTALQQTANPITFGHAVGAVNHNDFIGSCIIMSGDANVSQAIWLNENCL